MVRALAAAFTLWFALVLIEPAVLHACPVHNPAPVPTSAGEGAHHGHEAAPAPDHHSGAQCLCLGDCTTITGVGLPSSIATLVVPTTTSGRDTGLPDYAYLPVAAAHVIPFANGPPLV